MKSPLEYFIIEQDTNPRKGEREAQERLIKKLNRISKKGNIPDKLPYADGIETSDGREGRPSETRKKMAKEIATQDIEKSSGRESSRIGSEGSGKVKEPVKPEQARGYKPKPGSQKLPEYPGGSVVKTNKPQQKPLGRLVHKVTKERKAKGLKIGDLDYRDSKQLEAQRKGRIDTRRNLPSGQPNPKYGKATQKGVENFAQNRGGYGRGRKLSKTEWEKIEGSAKKISSDPSSKAYKDIEAKINKNRDYGGKRAQVMNPKQVAQVKKEKDKFLSKNRKGGKLTIQRTSKLLDTKTRKGRIANVGSPPTPPPNNPSFRKSVKGPGSSTGYLSKGNLKFSGDSEYNKLKKIIKNADGRSSNKPPVKPKPVLKPTPVPGGGTAHTNPQSMLRTPRKSTPKFDSSYNKKGDSGLRNLLKKNPVKTTGKSVSVESDPWDPKDYNSKGKSRKTRVDGLDKDFRKRWKEAQDKFKRDTQTKAPKPEWGKSTTKTPYKGTTIKNPTIRQYTSPTLTPSPTRTPVRTPVGPSGPSGSRTPVGPSGPTGPSRTSPKVTRNDTIPKYKPKPWKTFKGALSKAFIPATIGAQSYIDTSSAQKERGATKSRQVKTGLMDAGANVASWVGTGKLLDLHPAMRKRKLLKFALQTVAQPKVSQFVKNTTGISQYKATQTKGEKEKGITAQQPSMKKFLKKYPSAMLTDVEQKNLQKKSNFNVNYGFNKSGIFNKPKDSKNK